MAVRDKNKTEVEWAEEQVRDFNSTALAIINGLSAQLEEHRGGDFTITVGMDDGRDEPWPVAIHAVYNDVDGFDEWWSALDRLETIDEQREQIAEDLANYVEAVAAGHGDWHLGTRRIARRKEQNA